VADAKQGERKVLLQVCLLKREYTVEVLEVKESFKMHADSKV
jgi:hypothetical protein